MTCKCAKCPSCDGTGDAYYDVWGEYVGPYRNDDMAEPEPCEDCGGRGIEECGDCMAEEDD